MNRQRQQMLSSVGFSGSSTSVTSTFGLKARDTISRSFCSTCEQKVFSRHWPSRFMPSSEGQS